MNHIVEDQFMGFPEVLAARCPGHEHTLPARDLADRWMLWWERQEEGCWWEKEGQDAQAGNSAVFGQKLDGFRRRYSHRAAMLRRIENL